MPLISIITPTYNHSRFIESCIDSVLRQTCSDWEMIIIDDASTDETASIIEQYAEKDTRIKIIRHALNYGMERLSDTYNEAFDIAQGKYIAVLEGDDFWPVDKLEKQIVYFEDPEIVLCYGNVLTTAADGKIIADNWFKTQEYFKDFFRDYKGYAYEPLLLRPCFIPAVTVMVRKNVLAEVGKFIQLQEVPLVDYPTWMKISFRGKFYGSSDVLGYHRRHSSAQSLLRVVEMTEKERKIAFCFYNEEYAHVEKMRSLFFRSTMMSSWIKEVINAYWIEGRCFLNCGERRKAVKSFLRGFYCDIGRTLAKRIIMMRLKCAVGIVCAALKINLEKTLDVLNAREMSAIENVK